MPFHEGVYYPYTSDTQGTHSSAGIPSLLNSPLSQNIVNGHTASSAPGMTPSSTTSTFLPFKFRPRRESVDWRRINAVDVDLVVSQLDVDALQEHISMVTFCSLEGERCQRCQTPVDPALLKLLRLAQLTVEWLLHCQDFLSLNLRAAEERLSAIAREREQLLVQQKKQEEKVKALTAELKQRKKVIRTQQSLLAPRIISSHKCLHCEKSFLNASFLQNHMQRRHPDEYESKPPFAAEEMARMDRKIEDSRDGMRREMEFLYNRNIQALNEVNQNQTAKPERSISPVHSQPERDVDMYKETPIQAIQKMEHQLKKQDKKWESRLQEMKVQHESEKNQLLNELSKMQSSLSEYQEQSQRQQQEMRKRLQEKEQTIKAQREQIKTISSNPPIKVAEVPVTVSPPAWEPKQRRVVVEEPVSVLKLDPIQEVSEEEKDSSSQSDRKVVEKKPEPAPEKKPRVNTSALKRNSNIKREIQAELEQALIKKLENLGVKPDQSGLKNKELTAILSKLDSKRESVAKSMSGYWNHREEIKSIVEQKLGAQSTSNPAAYSQPRSRHPVQVLQIRPRSSSLPSRASQGASASAIRQPKTPQPAPRTKATAQLKTSTPNSKTALKSFATNVLLSPSACSQVMENKISDLARKMEKQFAERAVKKPPGGVSVLPERADEVQELSYTDLEESSEWMVSSLEDRRDVSKPAQDSGPMRKSLESRSTSVWGTSTEKGPKSGLTEAGTGSTLKSSLCSLSDISDSEDIS
ncbi:zinc finger protein Dzip1 [Neolamprologus brichardi]|uniref:zinc finger protein Dzip1 n=1 Tax=Neolamprologus brichardi TaxID=32507 RepID=UPI001643886E|nr:zinc finger protein Dzip1 [Neolamprologus brichardi]